jgi:nucleotide-binding universal stress UspA family protein
MAVEHVMVAVGAFASSLVPAKYAVVLAKQLGARLTAVHVVNEKMLQELLRTRVFVESEVRQYELDLEGQGKLSMERFTKMAETKGVRLEPLIVKGEISVEVARAAQELRADILVMGELKAVFSAKDVFYDEGERLFRSAPCPVLVVRCPGLVESLYKSL